MLSSRRFLSAFAALFCGVLASAQTLPIEVLWAPATNDFTTPSNWTNGTITNDLSSTVAKFASGPSLQPSLAGPFSVAGVRFYSGNFTLSGAGTLTLGSSGIENLDTAGGTHAVGVSLVFGATTGRIQNNGSGSLTISGSVTNNTSGGLTLLGNGQNGVVSGVIGGSGALIKEGTVDWTLSGTNTYTGSTVLRAGSLVVSSDANLGAVPGTANTDALRFEGGTLATTSSFTLAANRGINLTNTAGGGAINVAGNTTLTYAGSMHGPGYLLKQGLGRLLLSGTNTNSGYTRVEEGTLEDGAANAFSGASTLWIEWGGNLRINFNETVPALKGLVEAAGNVTIGSGAILTITGTSGTFAGDITGAGALKLQSGSYQQLTGTATYTGGTTMETGAVLAIGDGYSYGSVAGLISNNGEIRYNRAGTVQVGGISGFGGIRGEGTGVLQFTGSNTYSGRTDVTAGSITDTVAGGFSPNSGIYLMASGVSLDVTNNESIAGLGGAASSVGTTTTIAATKTLTLTGTGLSYLGTVGGSGAITLAGGGFQTFGGANTYTGGTTINGGTLVVTNSSGSATGTGAINIASGGALQIGDGGSGGNVSGNITNAGRVVFAGTGTTAYDGAISGAGSLHAGLSSSNLTGTLTLTNANHSYTGFTNIHAGTLRIGIAGALPDTNRVSLESGTLDVANNQTISQLYGGFSSAVTLAAGAMLTIQPNTSNLHSRFEGVISGNGTLTFAGASDSSLTLNRSTSTFSGGMSVTGGTLYVGAASTGSGASVTAGPVGTGTLQIGSGGTIAAEPSLGDDLHIGNNLTLASGATLRGGSDDGALILSGTVTVPTGSATVNLANLVQLTGSLTSGATAGATSLTIASSPDSFGTGILLGTVAPSIGTITASGAGVIFGSQTAVPTSGLQLTASNGYVGIADVPEYTRPTSASVLALIDAGGRATFNGTLGFDTPDLMPTATFAENLNLAGFGGNFTLGSASRAILTGIITPDATHGYRFGNGGGALVVSSNLTAPVGVTVASTTGIAGNGFIAVLRGANTFTGGLSVSNSAVLLDSAGALPASTAIVLGADGYLGFTENAATTNSFGSLLSRVAAGGYASTSVIGVDSSTYIVSALAGDDPPSGSRFHATEVDLSGLSSIYFGTATSLFVGGVIKAPNQGGADRTLSLIGAYDGDLVISSPLLSGNVNRVVVGTTSSSNGEGSVTLYGNNTYTGGTTLKSGELVLGSSTQRVDSTIVSGPLGTGTLTVAAGANKPVLTTVSSVTLDNPISLGGTLGVGAWLSDTFASAGITLNGSITNDGANTGRLVLAGDVTLNGDNSFSGGVEFHGGWLSLGHDNALGTGTLSIGRYSGESGAVIETYGGRTLANNISFDGPTGQAVTLYTDTGLTLNGTLSLNNTLDLTTYGRVNLLGRVTGMGGLMLDGGNLYLAPASGSNDFNGRLEVYDGTVVFGNANAMPAGTGRLLADYSGYIGVSFVPANLQADFLDKFDKATTSGAIGFDSPNLESPLTFSSAIDLSTFSNSGVRLGSASRAVLTGTITPRSSSYNFGGGGGLLEVISTLVDNATAVTTRYVALDSNYDAPTTVRLLGANTYTGGTYATYSGVIFGSGALPATGVLDGYESYIGTEDSAHASTPSAFITRFDSGNRDIIVGFDSFTGSAITVSGNISLTHFNSVSDPQIILGTATKATINSSSLVLPATQGAYRFAGYKGGQLTVASTLADGASQRSVVIGSDSILATLGNPIDVNSRSAVTLTGNNTYTGGTLLVGGELWVGHANALGNGTLTIGESLLDERHSGLFAGSGGMTIANNIVLNNHSLLDIGGADNLTLNGNITDAAGAVTAGMLFKVGAGTLRLGGNNTFTGGIQIEDGNVTFGTTASVGTGGLSFIGESGSATFEANTSLTGLYGWSGGNSIGVGAGKTLSVSQADNGEFAGSISGSGITVAFAGANTKLHLTGASTYSGTTTVGSGITVLAGNDQALGSSSVTVNGGKLAVASGVTLTNTLALTNGALGGNGTFKAPALGSGFTIGSSITLAPGMSTGTVTFDGGLISTSVLILASGGTYNWEISDALNTSGGWDQIAVAAGSVSITATNVTPFNFSLKSILGDGSSGWAANFNPNQAYSWTVLSVASGYSITGFTGSSQFAIDSTNFYGASGGTFTLALNGTSTALVLNFTPIPEPSTYLLMLAGVGLTWFASRRRRS